MARETLDLGHRLETFLAEFRMLIPTMGVLMAFQLTVAFQSGFDQLDTWLRALNFGGLACTALALLFLLVPAAYHKHVSHAHASEHFLSFARLNIRIAFAFMPLAIAASVAVLAHRTFGSPPVTWATGGSALLAFLLGWWVGPFLHYRSRRGH